MNRRQFNTLRGGEAAWPLAARAQEPNRVRRIGVLMHTGAGEPEAQARLAAFMQGLQELGWAVGRNMRIDYRWTARAYQSDPTIVGQYFRVRLLRVLPRCRGAIPARWTISPDDSTAMPSLARGMSAVMFYAAPTDWPHPGPTLRVRSCYASRP